MTDPDQNEGLVGKPAYDVFISYQSADRARVTAIKQRLSDQGMTAFLDRDALVVGVPWPQALERALRSVRAVVVFVGNAEGHEGLGLWQRREVGFALDLQAQREGQGTVLPVIPVLLPGSRPDTGFLFLNTWIDLREAGNEASAIEAIANAARLQPIPASPVVPDICPYRALEAFREEDAVLFFGRETFANDLLARVLERPLVALVGASGAGKSSVIQAGLLPLLRRQRPPQRSWDIVLFRPGPEPFQRLAASLIPLLEPDADEVDKLGLARKLGDRLADGTVRLEDAINRLLTKSGGTDRLLVIADQFEELFTLTPAAQRRPFVTTLLDALDRAPFTTALVLRADFYGQAISLDRRLSDHLQSGIVNLAPMTRPELRRAIEQPADRSGLRFEPGLVERILDQVESQPGGLPVLEFALTQLWERRDRHHISHAIYDAIGEIGGAIGRRAEAVFLMLDDRQQRGATTLFTHLVRASASTDTGPDTRRSVSVDMLNDLERSVLHHFVAARLLVVSRRESAGPHAVELAHEALIQGWPRFVEWIRKDRTFLLWRQRLDHPIAEWLRTARSASVLLQGPVLKEARAWRRARETDLSETENEFIRRSDRKQRRRRHSIGAAIGLALLVLGVVPAMLALTLTNRGVDWISLHVIVPASLPDALPSDVAGWIHAMDVAGRLDEIGTESVFVSPEARLSVLQTAVWLMLDQQRPADAAPLLDRAVVATREVSRFDSDVKKQLDLAEVLALAGRKDAARPMVLQALQVARQQPNPETRAHMLADAAQVLAMADLKVEARTAIGDARPMLTQIVRRDSRLALGDRLARGFVWLRAIDEAWAVLRELDGGIVSPSFVQLLADVGYLDEARSLVGSSNDYMVSAVLASSLLSSVRRAEAQAMTQETLERLEATPFRAEDKDEVRADFYQRLLLQAMSVGEAVAFVRQHDSADQLASLAVALARAGQPATAVETAQDAARQAARLSTDRDGARILAKVTQALALSGRAELAFTTANGIQDSAWRSVALGDVAYGLASEGKRDQAAALVRDLEKALTSMAERSMQSSLWTTTAITRVRLGDYTAVYDREGGWLNFHDSDILPYPGDVLRVATWIVRDAAPLAHGDHPERVAWGPKEQLGRYNLHWP